MFHEARGRQAMGFMQTKPVMIITTLHESGVVNAGVFGAYTNISPTQIAVAVGTPSHTYGNIIRGKDFTVNIPGAGLAGSLQVLASAVPPERSELEEAGLTAKAGLFIGTPSIEECAAACEFCFQKDIPVGYHNLIIGEIRGGWIRKDFLDEDGRINIFKARVMKDYKYPEPLYVLPGEVVRG